MIIYYSGSQGVDANHPEVRCPGTCVMLTFAEIRAGVLKQRESATVSEGSEMLIFYHVSSDPLQKTPERVLGRGKARITLSYNDVKVRRHNRYFKSLVRARRGK